MTQNTDKKSLRDKIKQSRAHAKIKEFILTTATLMAVCGGAQAQTKKKEQKDDKEGFKTELNVSFSNISALEVQKDKAFFYNDLFPKLNAGIQKDGWFANAMASELIIFSNNNWNAVNNNLNVTFGKYIGEDTQIYVKAGRFPMQAADIFFNGVGKMDYWTDSKGFALFGDPQQALLVCAKHKGHEIMLGLSNKINNGYYFFPNMNDPEVRAVFAKINEGFKKDGWTIALSAAVRMGQKTHQGFANVSATNGQIGVAAGGNYDFDSKNLNAYIRAAYTSLESSMTYVVQAVKAGQTYAAQLGVGKNGVQGFVSVENITPSQNKAPEFTSTPTVNFGVSYSFGGSRKL